MPVSSLPIVLVHGFWDTSSVFDKMAVYLKGKGYEVHHSLNLVPNNGKIGLEQLAKQLKDYIEVHIGAKGNFILIGFSMGGLVARYYLQRLGGIQRSGGFITIASPHHGTYTAYVFNRIGAIQMRPDSEFLKDLNSDATILEKNGFASIWAKYDTTIVPNVSSRMSFGKEYVLPFGIHPLLPYSNKVLNILEKALEEMQPKLE